MAAFFQSTRGKKLVFGLVIALSALVIVLNLVGVIGVWAVERPLSAAAVDLLALVERAAQSGQTAVQRLDAPLEALEGRAALATDSAQRIGTDINDRGLILTLLPAEQEQRLADTAGSVRATYAEVRAVVQSALDLYHSVNRLPFVSLPGPDADQLAQLDSAVTQVQDLAESLRSEVAAARAGAVGAVGRVESAAGRLTAAVAAERANLVQIDSRLAALERFAQDMQSRIPGLLATVAFLFTLLLAYVIYTQVEVIRLFVARWQALPPAETPE